MDTQLEFVACRYSPADEKTYTFANKSGVTLSPGERVRVENSRSTGIAYVAEVGVPAPDCPPEKVRAVLALAPKEEAAA